MRILHILSSDDQYGSALCFKELLQCELEYKEIVPIVVTPKENKINQKCNELKVKNYVVDYGQLQIPKHDIFYIFIFKYLYHWNLYYAKMNKSVRKILQIIEKEKVDIIHTNSCVVDIGAIVAKKTGLINIWHLRELGKQDFNFYPTDFNFIKKMNGENNKFIAISDIVKQTWKQRGLEEGKITTIYDGVDGNKFEHRSFIKKEKLRFVMCGSFCEAKGQKLLIEAVRKLNSKDKAKVLIDFYGKTEGLYFEEISKIIKKNGLDEIFSFKGYSNNIPDILKQYDVGILCSRAEAFGRVTVEYMMAGLCTIAPASGANMELIQDGCGILYKAEDASELSNVISSLINNEVDYMEIGNCARKVAMNNYDINQNASKIINYFFTLSEGRK